MVSHKMLKDSKLRKVKLTSFLIMILAAVISISLFLEAEPVEAG